MARPLSEKKRNALLDAAMELVAKEGTATSTSKIAKAAGVSEGTLFTYFATKDDLLNSLFIVIETSLSDAMSSLSHTSDAPREQLYQIWQRLVEWGLANPIARSAMRQLKVSDRISEASRLHCNSMFADARAMVERSLSSHADPALVSFYIETVLFGLADIAMDAIAVSPKDAGTIRTAGFELFWKGTAA